MTENRSNCFAIIDADLSFFLLTCGNASGSQKMENAPKHTSGETSEGLQLLAWATEQTLVCSTWTLQD